MVQLAVSAAKADGALTDQERALISSAPSRPGSKRSSSAELNQMRPLADIVAGVTDQTTRNELYVLAFTIVRADEDVSGAERIYLAQLAYYLGLDAAAATGAGATDRNERFDVPNRSN